MGISFLMFHTLIFLSVLRRRSEIQGADQNDDQLLNVLFILLFELVHFIDERCGIDVKVSRGS